MSDPKDAATRKPDRELIQAVQMLSKSPAVAEARLRDLLKAKPDDLNAPIYLARALRIQARFKPAIEILEALRRAHPRFAAAHYELALANSDFGATAEAISGLRKAISLDPNLPNVWLVLGDMLFAAGDREGADAAYMQHIDRSGAAPHIRAAMAALRQGRPETAIPGLVAHLSSLTTDVAAMAVLGEAKARLEEYEEADTLLQRCLERVPSFAAARLNYATVLCRLQHPEKALRHIDFFLSAHPDDARFRALKAIALHQAGDPAGSLTVFEGLLADCPEDYRSWTAFGHALRGEGRQKDAIDAYRRSIAVNPLHGDAYWGIANLKTVRLNLGDVTAINSALARRDLPDEERVHFHFALAKALEDQREFEQAFEHYEKGNALQYSKWRYDPDIAAARLHELKAMFTQSFLQERRHYGAQAADPIFIIGMPRSGSTLIEQILASHSAVEGMGELPDILLMARKLDLRGSGKGALAYPRIIAHLSHRESQVLGEGYLDDTRARRKSQKPYFTDKMLSNFENIGLIQLILPKAKIIDARRHPMGCCLSNYKQLYAQGLQFSYNLTALGRCYADYVELMKHFDDVLPGRIHRVLHEDIVSDPEREIRRLLDYCELSFEPLCLEFDKTNRHIRTISSEQVRRPIFPDSVDHWRNFEPWLKPLKSALGSVLTAYPAVPDFN